MKQFRGLKLAALPALTVAVFAGFAAGACYAQSAGPVAAGTGPLFLRTLHVTGFLQNTSSTWIDSEAIEYVPTKNSLASERNLIQVDVDDEITENDYLFARLTGVYEPSYPFENSCSNANLGTVDCNSDFYNAYGIREVWLNHRAGPLRVFVGRQIVAWGESLAFRVVDQINPQDFSWAFGFVNLENSRNPLWMFHPILNLPDAGPLSSNFAELIYVPGFDLAYTQVDYTDDAIDGQDQVAGRVNVFPATPGGRFAIRTDTRSFPAGSVPFNNALAFAPPIYLVRALAGCPPPGLCAVVAGGEVGIFTTDVAIPRATWCNSQIGVRLHTLAFNTEMAAIWLWNHEYSPLIKFDPEQISAPSGPTVPFRQERAREIFPQYMGAGVTANRPLYLPGALSQLPFVVRAEAFYKNHAAFGTLNIPGDVFVGFGPAGAPSGIVRSDEVLWLFALDLDQAYAPWLTSTGNLTANLEINGTTILSYSHRMINQGSFEHIYHNDVSLLFSIGTSWLWGSVTPNWSNIYDPDGQMLLLFPTVQVVPPWSNKYFMKFGYVGVLGTNKFGADGGAFKGKSLLYVQFQYNFSLM
jgi:hypothetical protein